MWKYKYRNEVNTKSLIITLLSTTCCGVFLIILVSVFRNPLNFPKSNDTHQPNPSVNYKNTSTLLDIKNFTYNIFPKCNASMLIWIVISYAGDYETRYSLRRAYNSQELNKLGIQRVFLLGKFKAFSQIKLNHVEDDVENEARDFQDILQGNFFETYHHLTYKHVMGLKWIVENCHNIPYIMKMDDDIVINLYEILNNLKTTNINNSIAGKVLSSKKSNILEKSNITDNYPQFVSGWLYLTSYNVAVKLIHQLKPHSTFFSLDDIFVTGILREETKVELVDLSSIFTFEYEYLKCCIEFGKQGVQCEFAIGPSNDDKQIQLQFKHYSDYCRQTKCRIRTQSEPFGKNCP